jgi:hypothetical protein
VYAVTNNNAQITVEDRRGSPERFLRVLLNGFATANGAFRQIHDDLLEVGGLV